MSTPSEGGIAIVRGVSIYQAEWQTVKEYAAKLSEETGERVSTSAALRRIIREWETAKPTEAVA